MFHRLLVLAGIVRDEQASSPSAVAIALWVLLLIVLTYLAVKYI